MKLLFLIFFLFITFCSSSMEISSICFPSVNDAIDYAKYQLNCDSAKVDTLGNAMYNVKCIREKKIDE